jgi:hypothetical protein
MVFIQAQVTVHTKAWLTVEKPPGGKMFHFSWLHVETKHGAQKQPICQLEPEQRHFSAHMQLQTPRGETYGEFLSCSGSVYGSLSVGE